MSMNLFKPLQACDTFRDHPVPVRLHIRQIHISCSEGVRNAEHRMSGEQPDGLGEDFGVHQHRGKTGSYIPEEISRYAGCLRNSDLCSLQGKEFYPFGRNLPIGACCSASSMSDRCRSSGVGCVELVLCLIMFW